MAKGTEMRRGWVTSNNCRKIEYEKGLRVQAIVASDKIVAHN